MLVSMPNQFPLARWIHCPLLLVHLNPNHTLTTWPSTEWKSTFYLEWHFIRDKMYFLIYGKHRADASKIWRYQSQCRKREKLYCPDVTRVLRTQIYWIHNENTLLKKELKSAKTRVIKQYASMLYIWRQHEVFTRSTWGKSWVIRARKQRSNAEKCTFFSTFPFWVSFSRINFYCK